MSGARDRAIGACAQCQKPSAVAGIDYAEAVAFRVGQHHEVRVAGVVPGHPSCTKPDKPLDLGRLLGRVFDHEIEMDPRPFLDRSERPMHRDPCSYSVGRNQDGEAVTRTWERHDLVAEHVAPEGGGTIDIVGAQDDRPKAQHDESFARRFRAPALGSGIAELTPMTVGSLAVQGL